MKTPRGPVADGDAVSREWARFFEALARDKGQPRIPRGLPDDRDWQRWFAALGAEALPRGSFTDAGGRVSRDWRKWLEAL